MVQIVNNLLSNALKFTAPGGHVTLRLQLVAAGAALPDGHEFPEIGAYISVHDTGVGIPPEDLPHLFERFYRKSAGGHGLGLAIVRRIIDLHGGRVEAHSTPGQGTVVTLRVPGVAGAG